MMLYDNEEDLPMYVSFGSGDKITVPITGKREVLVSMVR